MNDGVNPVSGSGTLESRKTFQLKLATKTMGDPFPAALWTIYSEASAQNTLARIARARIQRWSNPRKGVVFFHVEDDDSDILHAIKELNGVSRNGFPLPKPSFDVRHEDLVLPRHAALVSHAGRNRDKKTVPAARSRVGSERTLLYVLKGHASEREAVVAALLDAYLVVERLNPGTVPDRIIDLRAATYQKAVDLHVVELIVRCHRNVAVAWNADIDVVGQKYAPPQMHKKSTATKDAEKLSWVFDEEVGGLIQDARRLLAAAEKPRAHGRRADRPLDKTDAAFALSLVVDLLGGSISSAPYLIGALGLGALLFLLGADIVLDMLSLVMLSLAMIGAFAAFLTVARGRMAVEPPDPTVPAASVPEGPWTEIRSAIAADAPSLLPQIEAARERCKAILLAAPDVGLPSVIDAKLGATKRLDDLMAAYRKPAALASDGERAALAERLGRAVIDIGQEAEEARVAMLGDASKRFETELRYLESRRDQEFLTSLPSSKGDA